MIKRKSKALLCAIASIGFINSIEIIHANAYNNSFSDTKGHWAEAEISKFNDLGYISGYEDKTFKPNNSVTRAEFVKILNNVCLPIYDIYDKIIHNYEIILINLYYYLFINGNINNGGIRICQVILNGIILKEKKKKQMLLKRKYLQK